MFAIVSYYGDISEDNLSCSDWGKNLCLTLFFLNPVDLKMVVCMAAKRIAMVMTSAGDEPMGLFHFLDLCLAAMNRPRKSFSS